MNYVALSFRPNGLRGPRHTAPMRVLPIVAFTEVQTFTATRTYILDDHDSN